MPLESCPFSLAHPSPIFADPTPQHMDVLKQGKQRNREKNSSNKFKRKKEKKTAGSDN